ncbi:hypothetical protein C5S31_11690 [ANME-1 cluster archaeon GoMg2]|nr:hypothetical protein [ANME-1 cluster archaeon GoMg2]
MFLIFHQIKFHLILSLSLLIIFVLVYKVELPSLKTRIYTDLFEFDIVDLCQSALICVLLFIFLYKNF